MQEAVLYSIKRCARIDQRAEKKNRINLFAHSLQRSWSPEQLGRVLSEQSRAAVEQIWRNHRRNRFERKAAFRVWCQTPTRDELSALSTLECDPVLANAALSVRLASADQSAVPLLQQRIWHSESGQYWWSHARQVGLLSLRDDVQRYFVERGTDLSIPERDSNTDLVVAELLMDANDDFAAQILVEQWEHVKTTPSFVQAALYLATPKTIALAQAAITDCKTPEIMLKHIDMRWGISMGGRAGVTDLRQLQALEPYYVQMSKMNHSLIDSFFDAANKLGARRWRQQHLDCLIVEVSHHNCTSDKQTLFASLDREVTTFLKHNRRRFGIDHWFKRRQEELWERGALIAIIGEWTCTRASQAAVNLLCETLLYFGERRDLTLFDSLDSSLAKSCADVIANCIYDVQRRSLSSS